MADRWWLGGNWNTTASWSATNNGAGGASIPGSSDNVYWHTVPASSIYTINATASCLDFDFTGATNSPTLAGSSALSIYGIHKNIASMTVTHSGGVSYRATSTGKTITTAGKIIQFPDFNGLGGEWTLQDDFSAGSTFITYTEGAIVPNGKTISGTNFNSGGSGVRNLALGSSILNLSGNWNIFGTTNLTFDAGTSTINMTGASKLFVGAGKTYYNVNAVGDSLTVSGANTYNLFTPTPGNTVIFTISETHTALTNFVFSNNTVRSTVAGTFFTLAKTLGNVIMRGCSVKDCHAGGGAVYSAIRSSTNVSGNTGITFGSYVVVEKQLDGRKYVLNAAGVLTAL